MSLPIEGIIFPLLNSNPTVKPIKVYVAGPLFFEGDRLYMEKICKVLDEAVTKKGDKMFSTYLPHRDGGICPSSSMDNNEKTYLNDIKYMNEADLCVACLVGADVDSGTAFEVGYLHHQGTPIIACCDDIRIAGEEENRNLMITNSVYMTYTWEQYLNAIKEIKQIY